MQHPKVLLIGAGSLFFGRQCIWQMTHSEHLKGGTLALVDTDAGRLQKMATLARKTVDHFDVPLAIEASVDRREVLADADFVVFSFADRSVKFRGLDCEVAAKYGVRMCSGDTVGPGGIFRTLRELPVILDCCRDVEAICPDAWVINYINPTTAHGIGIAKYAPNLKSFALCDGPHMPHFKRRYAKRAGIIADEADYTDEIAAKFDFVVTGVNHFTWCLKAEYEGADVAPEIAESLRAEAATETDGGDTGAKAKFNASVGYELYRAFGHMPTCVSHTKEYVRFWQGHGTSEEAIPPLSIWQTAPRYERHDAMWKQVDDFNSGATPMAEFTDAFVPDHATDIIESMVAGLGKQFYVNVPNRGTVTNMPDDAFLEMCCDIDLAGVRPLPIGAAPVGLRGLWQQVLDAHELAVDAAVTCNRTTLRTAMLTDPIVSTLADADKIIEELIAAEADALPAGWFE